ncbi:MAG: hypothetical protein IT377_04060 [Polyangiaceae bacterium]|nr:hypothetical protein [Polyangiaceae bacterium]
MSESSFTGKEEDVEVGLQYFGKRYYAPLLNRWVSADPLAVHGLGADLNAYAYVGGSALRSTDPQGLDLADFLRGMATEAKASVVAAAKDVYASAKADAEAIKAGTKTWSDVAKQQGTEVAKAAVGLKLVESAGATVKRVAKAPGQVSHALKAGSDYEAGRRALRPVVTAMEVAATVGGAAGGLRAGAGRAVADGAEAGAAGRIRRSVSGVNPIDELGSAGRTANCLNCAVATDATLSGSPAVALKAKRALPVDMLEKHFGNKFGAATSMDELAQTMQEAGSGARGIVHASRGAGKVGHVFNVVNQGGTVRFLDGQTGKPAVVAGEGFQSYRLLRTDKK